MLVGALSVHGWLTFIPFSLPQAQLCTQPQSGRRRAWRTRRSRPPSSRRTVVSFSSLLSLPLSARLGRRSPRRRRLGRPPLWGAGTGEEIFSLWCTLLFGWLILGSFRQVGGLLRRLVQFGRCSRSLARMVRETRRRLPCRTGRGVSKSAFRGLGGRGGSRSRSSKRRGGPRLMEGGASRTRTLRATVCISLGGLRVGLLVKKNFFFSTKQIFSHFPS